MEDERGRLRQRHIHIAPLFRLVPLAVREAIAERALRQRLPIWLLSAVSRLADWLMP